MLSLRDTALISIVKKDIEVAWRVAEKSEQQRKLSTMMDPMIGRVMHQFSQPVKGKGWGHFESTSARFFGFHRLRRMSRLRLGRGRNWLI